MRLDGVGAANGALDNFVRQKFRAVLITILFKPTHRERVQAACSVREISVP